MELVKSKTTQYLMVGNQDELLREIELDNASAWLSHDYILFFQIVAFESHDHTCWREPLAHEYWCAALA